MWFGIIKLQNFEHFKSSTREKVIHSIRTLHISDLPWGKMSRRRPIELKDIFL